MTGRIPESAHVQIRTSTFAFEEAVTINDAAGTVALDASRTASDFEFRILANYAETPWRKVIVAPPPRLVPPLKLRAIYPAYTGWQPLDLPEGTVSVEAVNGSRFVLNATTDRPIVKAVLVCQNDPQAIAVAQACAPLATMPVSPGSGCSTFAASMIRLRPSRCCGPMPCGILSTCSLADRSRSKPD